MEITKVSGLVAPASPKPPVRVSISRLRNGVPMETSRVEILVSHTDSWRFRSYIYAVYSDGRIARSVAKGGRVKTKMLLAHDICQCPPGLVVIHLNRNILDFTQENLRAVTRSEEILHYKKVRAETLALANPSSLKPDPNGFGLGRTSLVAKPIKPRPLGIDL